MPFVIVFLLIANIVGFFLVADPTPFMLWPIPSAEFRPWQLLTYALLHGSELHLALNMIALMSFGPALVRAWGSFRFLACYMLAAALGGALQASHAVLPTVGASAAMFGLFAAYVMVNPHKPILTLFPRPLAAWKVLATYVALSLLAIGMDWVAGVAHLAHLGGVLVGVCFALAVNDKPLR